MVLSELSQVDKSIATERSLIRSFRSKREKQQRLIYLFQRDLLPGISGQILESKTIRDSEKDRSGVSLRTKIVGYAVVCGTNTAMLFYIFLFALQQTKVRQDAWFRSFMTWLGMDIILVCSMLVLISQIVIPSFVRKDLAKIKQKLISTIDNYRHKANAKRIEKEFNSADYLFVSTRLAKIEEFKNLEVAKIIANFHTPWPRQSYQYLKDYSHKYKSKFTIIFSSIGSVIVFLLGGFIQLPTAAQDAAVYSAFSAGFGYTVVLLAELYNLYPALIAIPVVMGIIFIHFLIRALSTAKPPKIPMKVAQMETTTVVEAVTDRNVKTNRRNALVHGVDMIQSMQQAITNIDFDTEKANYRHFDSSSSESIISIDISVENSFEINEDRSSNYSNNSKFCRMKDIIMESDDDNSILRPEEEEFKIDSSDVDVEISEEDNINSIRSKVDEQECDKISLLSNESIENFVVVYDEYADGTADNFQMGEEERSIYNYVELESESSEGGRKLSNSGGNYICEDKENDVFDECRMEKSNSFGMTMTQLNKLIEEASWAENDESVGSEFSVDISD